MLPRLPVCLVFSRKVVDAGGDALSGVTRLQEMTRKDVAMWKRLFVISMIFTVPLLLAHWLQVRKEVHSRQAPSSVVLVQPGPAAKAAVGMYMRTVAS